MNKPVTLLVDDFRKGIISQINESKLPMCFVEYILKDLLEEVHIAAITQLKNDRENFSSKSNNDNLPIGKE